MTGVFQFLQAQPFFVIFGVVAAGIWLGRKKIGGIALGSVVCIMLFGLLLSIWADQAAGVSLALPGILQTLFFNLFIFAIGVKVGPQFFAGLRRDGWQMVTIGLIVAVLAPALAYVFGWLFAWPQGTVVGVLAGSNNSSATFGAATSAVQSSAFRPGPGTTVETVTATMADETDADAGEVRRARSRPGVRGVDAGRARCATARHSRSRGSRGHLHCCAHLPGGRQRHRRADSRRDPWQGPARVDRTGPTREPLAGHRRHPDTRGRRRGGGQRAAGGSDSCPRGAGTRVAGYRSPLTDTYEHG
jgi:AspT/YidE/YbjL antiporter-like protein